MLARVRRGQRAEDVATLRAGAGVAETLYERVSAAVQAGRPVSEITSLPDGVDRDEWIYAQLCRLVQDIGIWLLELKRECRTEHSTCAALMVDQDVYLCPSHGDERQCTAFEYVAHVIDAAADTLKSERFPENRVPRQSARLFNTLSKQLARVFLHSRAHHAELFAAFETQHALYARFYALCDVYELYPTDALPAP
ncbi:hypothetical protein MCUN1_003524 [Malassezia cuniculi]|uniref:Mob1/phocein n=1 Tax=Malassezia cuniculi TaxID=948313 RepID=A0AAF0F1I6_9BASI|nr:hypothetical protein MCUN1_003524 [Malassezia cuniculi]